MELQGTGGVGKGQQSGSGSGSGSGPGPSGSMSRGNSDSLFAGSDFKFSQFVSDPKFSQFSQLVSNAGPLTSPARLSLAPSAAGEALLGTPALGSNKGAAEPPAELSSPYSLRTRSKSEPSLRHSLSNSLTQLPLYPIPSSSSSSSSSTTGFSSSLLSMPSPTDSGVSSETGSEPLDSQYGSDTDSLESDDERDASLAYYFTILPSPPPPPPPHLPPLIINRQRSSTTDSETSDSGKSGEKAKLREKKEKHSHWWRREEKEKSKDKHKEKHKESKKEGTSEHGSFNKRISVKIPHLTSHPSLLGHTPSPVSLLQNFNSTHSSNSTHIIHSAILSHENSLSSLQSITSSASTSFSSTSSTDSGRDTINSPTSAAASAHQSLSTSQSAPTNNPLSASQSSSSSSSPNTTPPPSRVTASNSFAKFHAQILPSNLPPPPTPPKPPVIETDLSNKRSNPGLVVEDDGMGVMCVMAGFVDELIYCLADRDIPDRHYRDVFLCTVSYFTTMEYVLKKLIERYEYPGEGPAFAQWRPMIQTRVLTVLRSALESYEHLFDNNPVLLVELRRFLESVRHSHPNKNAVREFDTLLRGTPPNSTLSGSTKTGFATLDRSNSNSFICLASSLGSSLSSSSSSSPNASPESNSFILNSIPDSSINEHQRSNSGDGSGNFSSIKGYSEFVSSLSTDMSTHGKSGSSLSINPSHSHVSLPAANTSPTVRERRGSIAGADIPVFPTSLISPPVNRKIKNSKIFVKVRPVDMAKQLTLIERDMFCKIGCTDVLKAAWKKKDKAQTSPNVVRMIEWFNKMAAWSQTVVVVTNNLRERIMVLSKIIQIAEHCIEHHNYSTGMSLVSGLKCSSVSRLAKTWKGLSRKDTIVWENLSEIFDAQGNFAIYRRLIHQAQGEAALPYLGVVLQDLLMVEELPTFMPNKMVNFRKMRRFTGLVKEEIQDRQAAATTKYNFESDTIVQDYFSNFAPLLDADLYKWSRMCEPAALA